MVNVCQNPEPPKQVSLIANLRDQKLGEGPTLSFPEIPLNDLYENCANQGEKQVLLSLRENVIIRSAYTHYICVLNQGTQLT